jgi:hypothetical protein
MAEVSIILRQDAVAARPCLHQKNRRLLRQPAPEGHAARQVNHAGAINIYAGISSRGETVAPLIECLQSIMDGKEVTIDCARYVQMVLAARSPSTGDVEWNHVDCFCAM